MKVIKSAVKAARQSRKREKRNNGVKANIRDEIRKLRKTPDTKTLEKVYSAIDKAVKHGVLHRNTAARKKSRFAKLIKVPKAKPSAEKK
ncbi:MAG: 30S ribosomal protein S20 [bacterium]|nr:30S ribosomal protein S20 [bacterium]